MISNVEILYGLANRCNHYGIKKNISNSKINPLQSILEIVDGLDGAEKYGWDCNDLKTIKEISKLNTFTKIDINKYDLNKLNRLIKFHSYDNGKTYLRGIYIHNKINEKMIEKYNMFNSYIKEKSKIKIGFSIYNQDELNFIIEKNLSFDILQIPYNLNVKFDINKLKILKKDIYLRSIFLQGVYFVDLKNKFNDQINKIITLQKNYLLEKANLYNVNLGQYLFSKSISFCQQNGFKGIIIGSSSIQRIKDYIKNHISIKMNEDSLDIKFDIISDYLADPRIWKT